MAMASVGLFGQAFSGCLKGFEFWQKAEAIGEDAILFQLQLDMAKSRLEAWAMLWDFEHGKHQEYKVFEIYRNLAITYLTYIQLCLEKLEHEKDVSPALEAASKYSSSTPDTSIKLLSKDGKVTEQEMNALRGSLAGLSTETNATERLK